MEQRILKQGHISNYMIYFSLFLIYSFLAKIPCIEAYKNYTVGDSLGWFDKLAKPTVDYTKWASGKTFSLGDFLIFNTDSNHTVIQTYNPTTYTTCDSQGDDNVQWSNIEPNSTDVRPITIAVPLLKQGATYFFSGDYDGEQCMNGQKFSINVTHGQGLPPSIKNNPDFASAPTSGSGAASAPGPANPDSGDDQSAPDTVISSDFNHPKKVPSSEDNSSSDEEDGTSGKKSNGAIGFMVTSCQVFFVGVISVLILFHL